MWAWMVGFKAEGEDSSCPGGGGPDAAYIPLAAAL